MLVVVEQIANGVLCIRARARVTRFSPVSAARRGKKPGDTISSLSLSIPLSRAREERESNGRRMDCVRARRKKKIRANARVIKSLGWSIIAMCVYYTCEWLRCAG